MWYWILILWIPFGSLYIFLYKELYVKKVSLWLILTDRLYHLLILDSGMLGFLTPLFNYLLRHYKRPKKKDKRHILKGADTSGKEISYV